MTSPFEIHRSKVLGHYSTAGWLRRVVMALWDGAVCPIGLSNISNLDDAHFKAFIDMVTHYRRFGEGDSSFQELVQEIQARLQQELDAAERDKLLQSWLLNAVHELRRLGKPVDLIDDRYNWFESRFDAGITPADAASECLSVNLRRAS